MTAPYRSGHEGPPFREVSFKTLAQRTTGARLAEACSGRGVLLAQPAPALSPGQARAMLLASLLLVLPLALLAAKGRLPLVFGQPEAIASSFVGFLLFLVASGKLGRWRRGEALPFQPGVYLFARDLIDARGEVLKVISTEQLAGVNPTARGVELRFDQGMRYEFTPHAHASRLELLWWLRPAEEPMAGLTRCRERVELAEANGDLGTLHREDPLFDVRGDGRILRSPGGAAPRPWLARGLRLALGAAALASCAALALDAVALSKAVRQQNYPLLARYTSPRGSLSALADAGWFEAATSRRSLAGLLLYIALEGARKDEARAAFDGLTSGRCASPECWRAIQGVCDARGEVDLSLVERSLPNRQALPRGNTTAAVLAALEPYPTLREILRGCGSNAPGLELARLLVADASMAPAMPAELTAMLGEPGWSKEARALAEQARHEMYQQAIAAVPEQDTSKGRRDLLRALMLNEHITEIGVSIRHELVDEMMRPVSMKYPQGEASRCVENALLTMTLNAPRELRLSPFVKPPSARLELVVLLSWQEGTFTVRRVRRSFHHRDASFSSESSVDLQIQRKVPPGGGQVEWESESLRALAAELL